MSETQTHYWLRDHPAHRFGADLAALRRGAGKDAGSVPQMWAFYTTLRPDGGRGADLQAEHVALTLYAMHQQSQPQPMHQSGTGVGTAIRALRRSGKFSEEAVDRRFAAAATATSLSEAALHLRGLIGQLRAIDQPLDYTRLFRDLRDWQFPDRVAGVRRRWGGQYHAYDPTAG
jgi:CRISPR system Cascade subunit CasB